MLLSAPKTKIATSLHQGISHSLTKGGNSHLVSSSAVGTGGLAEEPTDPRLMHLYRLGFRDLNNITGYDVHVGYNTLTKVEIRYELLPNSYK